MQTLGITGNWWRSQSVRYNESWLNVLVVKLLTQLLIQPKQNEI